MGAFWLFFITTMPRKELLIMVVSSLLLSAFCVLSSIDHAGVSPQPGLKARVWEAPVTLEKDLERFSFEADALSMGQTVYWQVGSSSEAAISRFVLSIGQSFEVAPLPGQISLVRPDLLISVVIELAAGKTQILPVRAPLDLSLLSFELFAQVLGADSDGVRGASRVLGFEIGY